MSGQRVRKIYIEGLESTALAKGRMKINEENFISSIIK